MAGRRKGEKPVIHPPLLWSEDCCIRRSILTGSNRLYAWIAQQCVPMGTLSKRTGIPMARLDELWRGGEATEGELEALAGPFRTDVASLRASIALGMEVRWRKEQKGVLHSRIVREILVSTRQ